MLQSDPGSCAGLRCERQMERALSPPPGRGRSGEGGAPPAGTGSLQRAQASRPPPAPSTAAIGLSGGREQEALGAAATNLPPSRQRRAPAEQTPAEPNRTGPPRSAPPSAPRRLRPGPPRLAATYTPAPLLPLALCTPAAPTAAAAGSDVTEGRSHLTPW